MAMTERRLKSGRGRTTPVDRTEVVEVDVRPWWLRLRSAVALGLLVVGLGVAAAAALGVIVLAMGALFDQALG
ncbi:MAG: hypothetical protein ABIP36_00925 [Acidimicrobiales bacterium]